MDIFQTPQDSHNHSLQTLELLNQYDDFMDRIKVVVDVGCGHGQDLLWWANNYYTDDQGNKIPRNYRCLGIDLDSTKIPKPSLPKNARVVEADFENINLPVKADLMWSHDSFRYAVNPLQTLKVWNDQINYNGSLFLIVPQTINITYNRLATRTFPGCYHNYTITNLMYMLAVNGFDCNDGQFIKRPGDPWIHCMVYKSDIEPMDPKTTSWYHLAEKNLLPQSAVESIKKWGYLRQEELMTTWLDKNYVMWDRV